MRNQRVVIAIIVGIVAIYVAADFIFSREYRKLEVNAVRVVAASQAYARDLRARGQLPPPTVGLQDLVKLDYIPVKDVEALDGVEVQVSLYARPGNPSDILLWAKLPDGEAFVVFADGNVQSQTPAK